ncbi:MAG: transglutaminase-like domain-containing protein [Acidimicrobiia bacterium]|nr:transglutaminase-like domain-containing protein [Acidimicrobiia bacterium]
MADFTARFGELVRQPEADIALDEACAVIAAHARPELDVASVLTQLDELAGRVKTADLDGVLTLLFAELGFTGNRADYADVDNSLLDQVLARRVGLPITLSIVLMEVARRVGLSLAGVGMPAHFLVRTLDDPPCFVDAFNAGRTLDEQGCVELFAAMQGAEVRFDPRWLEPVGARSILARVLANLAGVFGREGSRKGLVWALRLRSLIPGMPLGERRALAGALAAAGDLIGAAVELEGLAEAVGDQDERGADALRAQARSWRARLN